MSTATLPAPTLASIDDDGVDHFYCCDEDVAMCGADLTGVEEVDGCDPSKDCPLCVLVLESGQPCPVPGCSP